MKKLLCLIFVTLMVAYFSVVVNGYSIWADGGNAGTILHFHAWSGFTNDTKHQFDLAFDEWNYDAASAKPSSLWIDRSAVDTSQTSYPVYNNANEITKGKRGSNKYLMETSATYATVTTGVLTLIEVDIDINSSHPWYNSVHPNKYFVQNSFTHEVGHVYGLNDVNSYSGVKPTMYAYSFMNDDSLCSIETDDILGIRMIYYGY